MGDVNTAVTHPQGAQVVVSGVVHCPPRHGCPVLQKQHRRPAAIWRAWSSDGPISS